MVKLADISKGGILDMLRAFLRERLDHVKKYWVFYVYFAVIGIIFLLTRLIHITTLPNGMHIDEISMGYNTWTLTEFGTDRYGVSWPVYFNNAGSGQSSLYVYLAVIVSKFFGYSLLSLRLVSVFFGAILLIFGSKAAYEMFGIRCACITAAIIDIMPVFIMSERWAFDCNAMLPMMAVVLFCSVKLIKTGRIKWALFTGVNMGLTLYSYVLSFLMLPVFVTASLIYCIVTKKISWKNIGLTALSGGLISIPILLYMAVVFKILPEFNIGSVSITRASADRLSEITWQGFGIKEFFSRVGSLTSYDRYDFMGGDKYGVFYLNTLHFFGFDISISQILLLCAFVFVTVMAIYNVVKRRDKVNYELILLFYAIAVVYPMLLLTDLAIYRFNAVYLVFALILAYAFDRMWANENRIVTLMFAVLFLYNFGSYCYYLGSGNFANDNKALSYFDNDLLSICETLNDEKYDNCQIYIDDTATYNAGLIALYGLRVEPDKISNVENMDTREMVYDNVHISIPSDIKTTEKAIYIIRDINSESAFYTTSYEQIELYERLINNNKAKDVLLSMGVPYSIDHNYYIFELN